jgi:hypothetical protein
MQAKKTGGIKEIDKRYFREIFALHAVDDKINFEGLQRIFEMVDFKPNEKQEAEFRSMFTKKELLTFNGNKRSPSSGVTVRLPADFQLEEQPEVQRNRRQECFQGKHMRGVRYIVIVERVRQTGDDQA